MDRLRAVQFILQSRNPGPVYITNQEFLRLINKDDRFSQTIRQAGLLPATKINNHYVINIKDAIAFVKKFFDSANPIHHA